ncbi:AraC-type DNA-binding protein [Verrucomicrobium sp. GAS474]|uniref:helix-turn-helix domain-containing protein n=1 Tax=Verrucomicrobium sp. GAS474 TaxID=1882831 RepID=UPI00087BF412|nr:helix-turn-helix domain-containing protein [Verrucomicrobium sp. GAS474]SDT95045.1 AraC-type DNA-binding protein [Verrucomicrobium sp. GAS474]
MSSSFYQLQLEDWSRLRVELAWVYDGPVEAAYLEESSPHYGQSIFLIRSGGVTVRADGRAEAKPGDWVLPRQGPRRQTFAPGTHILSIHLNLHWPGGKPLFDWKTALVFPSARFPQLEVHSRRLERLVGKEFPGARQDLRYRPASLAVDCRLRRHFAAWFEVYCRVMEGLGVKPSQMGSIDPRVLGIVEYLDHASFALPCREGDLAARAGLSISQLNRLFLRHFGLTPRRYLEKRRLDNALVQIHRSRPVKEIAYELGFKSLPHFSAWFRQRTGSSPTAVRRGDG